MRIGWLVVALALGAVPTSAHGQSYGRVDTVELGGYVGASVLREKLGGGSPFGDYDLQQLRVSLAPEFAWFAAENLAVLATVRGSYTRSENGTSASAWSSQYVIAGLLGLGYYSDLGTIRFGPTFSLGYGTGQESTRVSGKPDLIGRDERNLSAFLCDIGLRFKVPVGQSGLVTLGPTLAMMFYDLTDASSSYSLTNKSLRFDVGYSVYF